MTGTLLVDPLDIFFNNYSTTLAEQSAKCLTFDSSPIKPRPRRLKRNRSENDDVPVLRNCKSIERVTNGTSIRAVPRRRSLAPYLWGLDTGDTLLTRNVHRLERQQSWPLTVFIKQRTPSPLSRSVDDHASDDDDTDPEFALDNDDEPTSSSSPYSEESASKRRKTGQNGSEGTPGPTGSVPPKSRLGLAQNEIRIPSPRRPGVRRADRPRRPPPLEMSSGNRELPPPSAGMMSSMRNSGMVSPVVSGFPLHQADQTTRHAFRVAMHIKDAQRRLISDRKLGATPAFHEVPGSGPPPSAGPLPTLLTYIPPPLTGESGGSVADRRGDGVKNKVKGMRLSTGDMSSVRDGLRTAPAGRFGDEGPLAAEEEDELRETAGYDAFGRSYYEMDKQRQAMPPGPFGGEGGSEQPGKGRGPRTAHPGIAASMQKQQGGQGPNNQSHPPSLHIPPFQRPGMQLPPPPQLSERRFSQSTGEGGRGPPHLLPHPPPFYPYPPPGPLGRGMPPLPPGFASQYDRDRDMFMAHFSKFYDALLDSTQLRNDLATKIHKANELVGAHQVELRKVENLRIQYEAALADLKVRSEKLLGSPLAEPAGTSAAESAEEKGSEPVDETENVMEEPAKEAESTTQPEQPEQQETNETQPQETIPVVEASPVADSADVDADAEGDVEMEATPPILP